MTLFYYHHPGLDKDQQKLQPLNIADAIMHPSSDSSLFGSENAEGASSSRIGSPVNVQDLCPALILAKNISCAGIDTAKVVTTTTAAWENFPGADYQADMNASTVAAYGCHILPVLLQNGCQKTTGWLRQHKSSGMCVCVCVCLFFFLVHAYVCVCVCVCVCASVSCESMTHYVC